jgi:hypothetical protein
VTRIGLTLDEHFDLRVKPRAGADPTFHEAAQDERDAMFPMATVAASHHLRSRGYDCRPAILDALVRQGVVTPSQPDTWTEADVEAAALHLEDAGLYSAYSAMCMTLGCRYADFLRALREAADRETAKYGRPVPANDTYFVLHVVPPRATTPAQVSFTLCDDVKERIESGGVV